jgi:hypothetical protein
LPVILIVGVVVIANLPYLLGLFDPDPLHLLSGLGTVTTSGPLAGSTAVDPNSGFTAQALGHLSMVDWIHGHVPWWNPYEGLGSPLAGEMQAASFFPPTGFLLLSNGQVLSHLTVEIVAGLSTYFLLRRLCLGRPAAVAGGIAFGLNGVYSWVSHAPANPVAFLPLALLGVEMAVANPRRSTRAWVTIAVALSLSVYAGFPETAYIDGILVAIWVAVRFIQLGDARRTFLLTVMKGLGVGVLLTAPLLVAFADYLPQAYVGAHNGTFASTTLPRGAFSQSFLPYVYGPIDGFSGNDATGTLTVIWGSVGGFIAFSVVIFSLIGLYGHRLRALRFALLTWIILSFGRTFGIEPFQHIVNALPGMRDVAFFRYSDGSWELALTVLAAFGLDELAREKVPRWWILLSSATSLALLVLVATGAQGEVHRLIGAAHHHAWAVLSVIWAAGIVALVAISATFIRGRLRELVLVAVVAVDTVVMFALPEFSAPRAVSVDTAPVSFLQKHLDGDRFYTIGPIAPNYGSYFGLNSLDVNDLPIPKLWNTYVTHQLDRNAIPYVFNGSARTKATGSTALEEFSRHFTAFETAGVKYLVVPTGTVLPAFRGGQTLPRVFSDNAVQIYQLPAPVPMFSMRTGTCSIRADGVDRASVTCPFPHTLIRHQLPMNGWYASVNGSTAEITPYNGVFQQVRLPAGTSLVTFTYSPPHVVLGYALFFVGLACLAVLPLWRRGRHPIATHSHQNHSIVTPLAQAPHTDARNPASPAQSGAEAPAEQVDNIPPEQGFSPPMVP